MSSAGHGLTVAGWLDRVGRYGRRRAPGGRTSAPAAGRSSCTSSTTAEGPSRVTEVGSAQQGRAVVHDITYRAAGQDPVSAYLVVPDRAGRHPAALFLHWLATATTSNRSEFLDEAVALASGPRPVVSLLPTLTFPFDYGPVGDVRDRDSVVKQVVQLSRGLDLLDARRDVDARRVAVVGHDYGAMYATLLVGGGPLAGPLDGGDGGGLHDGQLVRGVLPGPAGRPGGGVHLDAVDGGPRRLRRARPAAGCSCSTPRTTSSSRSRWPTRWRRRPGPGATYKTYAVDHSMDVPAAQRDRDNFLRRTLR